MSDAEHPDYKVKLEIFEGPLDLLLYLIQKNELDIHDIPITLITEQYLETIALMQSLNLELAGEFLVMASMLMRIKSKMLLPQSEDELQQEEEEDPREELVQKLLEYMRFKEAAGQLRYMEEDRSKYFVRGGYEPDAYDDDDSPFVDGNIFHLITAFNKVLRSMSKDVFHNVVKDEFTVAEKVEEISERLGKEPRFKFGALFEKAKNKIEAITIFLALLEMIRLKKALFFQEKQFEDIEIVRRDDVDEQDFAKFQSGEEDSDEAHEADNQGES